MIFLGRLVRTKGVASVVSEYCPLRRATRTRECIRRKRGGKGMIVAIGWIGGTWGTDLRAQFFNSGTESDIEETAPGPNF